MCMLKECVKMFLGKIVVEFQTTTIVCYWSRYLYEEIESAIVHRNTLENYYKSKKTKLNINF